MANLDGNISSRRRKIYEYLVKLNLFKATPPSDDPSKIRLQLISTRVYICLLMISLIILIIYTSAVTFSETKTMNSPYLSQYLELHTKYSETLMCSCSRIAIDYKEFSQISFTLHQVCASNFISQLWINNFLQRLMGGTLQSLDFRVTGLFIFQALRSFCILVNDTIKNSLDRFYSNRYVSMDVTPPIQFENQVFSVIQQFQLLTIKEFLSSLRIMRLMTQANGLISLIQSNAAMSLLPNEKYATSTWRIHDNCSCGTSAECADASYIYRGLTPTVLYQVPGMKIGCFIVESLLQSNLQCFYNRTCLDRLFQYMSSTLLANITAMNMSLVSRFSPTTALNQIMNELMVEQWHEVIDYENYFNICQPTQCTYKVKIHNTALYIVTTIIGLIGGLITGLRLCIPYIVAFILRERKQKVPKQTAYQTIRRLLCEVRKYLKNLNLFSKIPPLTDAHEIRNQLISTRVFIIVYAISIISVLIYTVAITITHNVVVDSPTFQQYSQLHTQYSQTLSCPCSRIAIDYGRFLKLEYTLHPVCSSDFISQTWIDSLFPILISKYFNPMDFRRTGLFTFQGLRSLCTLVNDSLINNLDRFYSNLYISMAVTPEVFFRSQIESYIVQFQLWITREFLSSVQIVKKLIHSNYIFSALQTNAIIFIDNITQQLSMTEMDYHNCSCVETSTCSLPSAIYDTNTSEILYLIPGMKVGCYVFEALLQSDLRCLYDQTCMERWTSFLDESFLFNVNVLDRTVRSRFLTTTSVNELLDSLLIEQWNHSIFYNLYFSDCRPLRCEYSIRTRNHIIYIITTIIGLAGGLMTGLQIIVPKVINILRKKKDDNARTQGGLRRTIYHFIMKTIQSLKEMNLLMSSSPSVDPHEIQNQLISTRLYIFLLIISFIVLLAYNATMTVDETITKQSPSLEQYSNLYKENPASLTCPCSNIDVIYERFLQVKYTMHQVCSSSFISEPWIKYLRQSWKNLFILTVDFRITSASIFHALSSFCNLTNNTVSNALTRFYANRYVSMDITPRILFLSQMESAIKSFRTSVTREFLSSLRIVRDTVQNNGLMSAFLSNAVFSWSSTQTDLGVVPFQYGECKCIIDSQCTMPSKIFMVMSMTALYEVPGMNVGCFVIEALLKSNLKCFYNQTCLTELTSFVSERLTINITTMNSSAPSLYTTESTVDELLDGLLIEEWDPEIFYENYFLQCRPTHCIYRIKTKNSIINIVAIIISLLGGLMTGLELVVPQSVRFIRYFWKRRNRVHPVVLH